MAIYAPRQQGYVSKRQLGSVRRPYADLRPALLEGRGISNVGKALTRWGEKLKDQRDIAVVGDLYNQWRDSDRTVVSELFNKKGKDAVNLGQQYDEIFNKTYGRVDRQAENGAQQAALRQYLLRKREQNLDALARYEANEGHRYRKQQEAGVVSNAIADAGGHGFDSAALESTIADTLDFVTRSNIGMSPEALRALHNMYMGQIIHANIKGQIEIDPARALANIESTANLPAILGDNYEKVRDEARKETKQRTIDDMQAYLQSRYEGGGNPDFAAMRKEIRQNKLMPQDIKFEIRQWIDAYQAQHIAVLNAFNKELHDNELRSIAMMIVDKDFKGAKEHIRKSSQLSGKEILFLNGKLQEKGTALTKREAAEEEIRIRGRIRKGDNPLDIYTDIATSNLPEETQRKLIGINEREFRVDIKNDRNKGYDIIDSLIPTDPRMRGDNPLDKWSLELNKQRLISAKDSLDMWLESQLKVDRIPTEVEIKTRARDIGLSLQPTIQEQMEFIRLKKAEQNKLVEAFEELVE